MYSKGWSNFAPAEPATPAPTTPKPKIAAQPPTPARPVPVQPAVPMQAAPVASGGGFYGPDYMACLKVARYRSQFVHESMREEALGELLNECMFARGYSNFAPVEEENPNADLFLYYNN
jgi:hypothetical protein